jgi:hypothetical protein
LGEQVKVEQAHLLQNRDCPVLSDYRAMLAGLFQHMYGLKRQAFSASSRESALQSWGWSSSLLQALR